ncbi:MAG: serine/threonine protein kinase [Cyanobacteria bacterium SZAS LIN-5]|nr:serine/threonine protein kinase [Cyanobacteria bacterium SZAS LIN-5]
MDEFEARQIFAKTGITIGEVLDNRYQIVEVLGQGGMGTVFKATNLSLNKPVAVKALHMFLDNFAAARFQQEIKAMSMLSHPHLISVLDAGTTHSGTPYFVMEFLDGPALGDILKQQHVLPDARAVRMFVQMADALAYAHEQGIIHRDLKPNNVVVLSHRGKDFVKLVDLGIAKLVSPGADGQGLTMTGEIFGSPIYMSPEQCSGRAVDARSDIYSLGCLMFETVCGAPPFMGGSALETFNLHLTEDVPLISSVTGVQMTALLKNLEPVIARCMQKQPQARFQSMEELSQALEVIDRGGGYNASNNIAVTTLNPRHEDARSSSAGVRDWEKPERPGESEVPINPNRPVESEGPVTPNRPTNRERPGVNKNFLVGAGVFAVVFCVLLGASQMLLHRAPPAPVPVPTFIQNSQPYVDTASIQKSIEAATDKQLSQHCTVSYPENSGKTNVQVVAVYAGKGQEADNFNLPGNVEVEVGPSDKPITLVFSSYMPTNWKIMRLNPAVKIDRVLVSSYKSPITVTGVPAGVSVEKSWYQFLGENGQELDSPRKNNPFEFFTMGAALVPGSTNIESQSNYKSMKKIVEEHLHESLKSFQGAYREGKFSVP